MTDLPSTRDTIQQPVRYEALDDASLLDLRRRLINAFVAVGHPRWDAEDAVSEAMLIAISVLLGGETTRKWPLHIPMYTFCWNAARSMLSNRRKSAAMKTSVDCDGDPDRFGAQAPDPYDAGEEPEAMMLAMRAACQDDTLVLQILDRVESDAWTTYDAFAQEMSVDIKMIRAAWTRIRRRAARLRGGAA